MKTAIIYLYREDENTKNNLQFFVDHSFEDKNCDYHLIINDEVCTIDIPSFINKYYQANGLDFQSYKTLLNNINTDYDYCYFINSSCVGPFLPVYCDEPWYNYLNKILNTYDFIGPVAEMPPPSENFTHNPFIHTYMFGFNNNGLTLFIKLLNKYDNFDKDFCIYFERFLSNEIIKNNLKIKSLLTLFKNVNLNDENNWNHTFWCNSEKTCFEIPNNYHGIDLNPYEIIFVKNIRKPHEHRASDRSGISTYLTKQLINYKHWL